MTDSLPLEELDHLYETLTPEERDEMLQCLLIAASISGETIIQRLEECLLELAGRKVAEGPLRSLVARPVVIRGLCPSARVEGPGHASFGDDSNLRTRLRLGIGRSPKTGKNPLGRTRLLT